MKTNLVDRFVTFLETTEDPGELFAPDVLSDFTVPAWRYQMSGVEPLSREIRHDVPNRLTVRRLEPTATGFVLEADVEIVSAGESYYERTLWLITIEHGRIIEVVLYCSGEWDSNTRARHQREVTLLRA